jgi:repressor LexA
MRKALTSKQQKIYSLIQGFINESGLSPSLKELQKSFGATSLNTVVQLLAALERKGYIKRHKYAKRSIALVEPDPKKPYFNSLVNIPVVASVGCDDLSVFANQSYDEFIQVDKQLIRGNGDVVAVKAVGDSMDDAGINNGDLVLVQLTAEAKNGERIVAITEGMVTVKKLERTKEATILWPESHNDKYKPIILKSDFIIAGKVLNVIRKPSRDELVYDYNIKN